MSRTVGLLYLAVMMVACDGAVEPEEIRRIGAISFYDAPVVLEVPSTVQAGAPFEILIRTYGGGCVVPDETEVEVADHVVQITPYDIDIHSASSACPGALTSFDHRTTVTIVGPGIADLSFRGMRVPDDTLMQVHRQVLVQ